MSEALYLKSLHQILLYQSCQSWQMQRGFYLEQRQEFLSWCISAQLSQLVWPWHSHRYFWQDFFITWAAHFTEDWRAQPPHSSNWAGQENTAAITAPLLQGFPALCSPEQRTLVKTKNPNLPHAPSSPSPLPSPGMAKLLKNHSEHFPCPKRFSSKNLF